LNVKRKLILVAALLVAGCGSSGSSPTDTASDPDGTAPDASTSAAASVPAASVAPVGTDGSWYSCATTANFEFSPIAGRRLRIATTVAPITSIIANIAGDAADVTGVVPEGTNSHTFEPKPSVGKDLSVADLVFVNGLKLEEPTKELAKANLQKGAAIVELGSLTITEDQYQYDFSFPKEGGKPNPHLWTNPPMAACYASYAGQAMATMDPANARTYATNADLYIAKLEELHNAFLAASASVPEGNRKLVTYHDAYAYFATTYGWEVIGAIQVSSFEEPTPREVASLIKQVKDAKIPAIFGSEVFPSPVLEQIGKEAGVEYVDVLRDDDLPGAPGDQDHSFLGLMRFDYVTMVRALGGDPAPLEALNTSDVAPDKAVYPQ
jgi:ABC-type Zn uptake system ZnuABC Zn-binding protein ZnuA